MENVIYTEHIYNSNQNNKILSNDSNKCKGLAHINNKSSLKDIKKTYMNGETPHAHG